MATQSEILGLLATGKLTIAEATAQLDALKPQQTVRELTFKVTEARPESKDKDGKVRKASKGGACSVYGLNRVWPVTLYVEQWERLLAAAPKLQAFLKANESKLTRKH